SGLGAGAASGRSPTSDLGAARQLESILRRQQQVVVALARGARDFGREMQAGVRGLDQRLTETNRRLQTIGSGLGLRMQRAAEVTERGFSRATSRISLQLQRVAEGAERRMVQAAERSGRAWSRAAALASER